MIADAVSPSNTLDQPGLDPGTACDEENPGLIPGSERSPEKEMAAQSSTLAWKIPWMEKPGGVQPMGSQRVGHN